MNNDTKMAMIILSTLISTFSIIIGIYIGESLQRKEAIKRGYAQYSPTTANFEWIEKEREE